MKWWTAIFFGLAAWSQSPPFGNAEAAAYVDRVVAVLGGGAFRGVVIAGEHREPHTVPRDTVIVPAAFFLEVEDEAEFAAMIAHAIGHAALRHGVFEREGGGVLMFVLRHEEDVLQPLKVRSRIAAWEIEADRYGAEAASRAGFDGAGLARYLRRKQAAPERLSALEGVGASGGAVSSSEFERVRELIRTALATAERRRPSLRR